MKRQQIEIMAQILGFCIQARRKTPIKHENNLSHAQLKDYLSILTSRNLLAHDSSEYITTEKGYRFLQAFAELKDVLQGHTPRGLVTKNAVAKEDVADLGILIARRKQM